MANISDSEKQQQILALGRLGWTLRPIEQETGWPAPSYWYQPLSWLPVW
jgi:hypothetical protein